MSRRSSFSEEEAVESRSKATSQSTKDQSNSINRRLRDDLSRSPSPNRTSNSRTFGKSHKYRERSRSPNRFDSRAPRGEKRRRNDGPREHGGIGNFVRGSDSVGKFQGGSYDNRGKYRDRPQEHRSKRPRTRSRSPEGQTRNNDATAPNDGRSSRNGMIPGASRFGLTTGTDSRRDPNRDASLHDSEGNPSKVSFAMDTKNGADIAAEPEPAIETLSIEERRKRREAIKAKYKEQTNPLLVQALQSNLGSTSASSHDVTPARSDRSASPASTSTKTPDPTSGPGSPEMMQIVDDSDFANKTAELRSDDGDPSAADYDPSMDMQENRAQSLGQHEDDMDAADYNNQDATDRDVMIPETMEHADDAMVTKNSKPADDMFASDNEEDDDMFTDNTTKPMNKAVPIQQAKELDQSLLDNWDDPKGYYRVIIGELIDGRYHVHSNLGGGVFSGVARATDNQTGKLVAIKIVRAGEAMTKAGTKEIEILQQLCNADPDDKKHLIRLERSFTHKGHLCMVFENLSINLREVLKKFGRDVGITLHAVRSYARQMFLGLSHMRKCNIIHADLKPDNILVNEGRDTLKLADLGSAFDATTDTEATQYLVSRYYRAPEIILGLHYDFAIDMWSIGCTLFELYTGKILFTGLTNNQMLRMMMECRGKFSFKMLKKGEYGGLHFDYDGTFRSVEKDRYTDKEVTKLMTFTKPTRDLRSRLLAAAGGTKGMRALSEAERKQHENFWSLLEQCLQLNPEKRITPHEALKHPFIQPNAALVQHSKPKTVIKH